MRQGVVGRPAGVPVLCSVPPRVEGGASHVHQPAQESDRLADMAGGNNISQTTVGRWVKEVVRLLASRAERLDRVLKKIARKGGHVLLLDGTLVGARRRTGAHNRKNYSGKHKCHGLLFIALTDTKGQLLWVSAAIAGRSSEISACRHEHLMAKLREAGLGAIADLGFVGLDDNPDDPTVITGYKAARNRPLTPAKKQVNRLIAAERASCEHAFAHLKNWRVLTKLRLDLRYATALVRALMVLTHQEVTP
ncbi:transposase family protein [Streptomyces sp. DB-54]